MVSGIVTSGDSGDRAFLNRGIASYITSLSPCNAHLNFDNPASNSSYGEIDVWQRVRAFHKTQDKAFRAKSPTKASYLKTTVVEDNSGGTDAYFLVQLTGLRRNPNQVLSIDYSTRDGTATAGQD